jgi:hypothetical protein
METHMNLSLWLSQKRGDTINAWGFPSVGNVCKILTMGKSINHVKKGRKWLLWYINLSLLSIIAAVNRFRLENAGLFILKIYIKAKLWDVLP